MTDKEADIERLNRPRKQLESRNRLIFMIAALGLCSCASYAPINPTNNGNGWIVKKSLFADGLMYCFAPTSKNEKPVCLDAVDSQTSPGDGLDTFISPKKNK